MYVWSHLPLRFDPRPPGTVGAVRTAEPTPADAHRDGATRSRPTCGCRPKELVADGVATLTLASAGGTRCRRGPRARTSTWSSAPRPPGSTRCAAAPTTPRAYRVGILRDARAAAARATCTSGSQPGRHRPGPRAAQPLPARASPRYVFVAGGIGITPMLPMVAAAEAAGADWELLLRRPPARPRWRSSTSSRRTATGSRVWPQDEVGLLDLDALLGTPREDTLVYCCGPEPLLDGRRAALRRRGRTAPCTSSGSPPKPMGEPVRARPSRWSCAAQRPHGDRAAGAVDHDGGGGGRRRRGLLVRARAPAAPARPGSSTGCPTTVTRCSSDDEKATNDCMMICVSRSCGDRLVLDL